jgi:holo-[acyl-carrier protein] synthase
MIGIDLVSISRLRTMLDRSPGLEGRVFSETERSYCRSMAEPARHLAGTLAGKEAVIKAAQLGRLVVWARRIEIRRRSDGAPAAFIDGRPAPVSLSISHDGDYAVAAALILPQGDLLLDMNRVAAELIAKS